VRIGPKGNFFDESVMTTSYQTSKAAKRNDLGSVGVLPGPVEGTKISAPDQKAPRNGKSLKSNPNWTSNARLQSTQD